MTDKHPMLTPATLESSCFALMPTVLLGACYKNQQCREHSHVHTPCFVCFFFAANIFCPTLSLSLMPIVLFEYASGSLIVATQLGTEMTWPKMTTAGVSAWLARISGWLARVSS